MEAFLNQVEGNIFGNLISRDDFEFLNKLEQKASRIFVFVDLLKMEANKLFYQRLDVSGDFLSDVLILKQKFDGFTPIRRQNQRQHVVEQNSKNSFLFETG